MRENDKGAKMCWLQIQRDMGSGRQARAKNELRFKRIAGVAR